jgi:hypothetical protein
MIFENYSALHFLKSFVMNIYLILPLPFFPLYIV